MCDFCKEQYNGMHLCDRINSGSNRFELSLVGTHLRLWKDKSSYVGCYGISFCPVCGRLLEDRQYVDGNKDLTVRLEPEQLSDLKNSLGYVIGVLSGLSDSSGADAKQALSSAIEQLRSVKNNLHNDKTTGQTRVIIFFKKDVFSSEEKLVLHLPISPEAYRHQLSEIGLTPDQIKIGLVDKTEIDPRIKVTVIAENSCDSKLLKLLHVGDRLDQVIWVTHRIRLLNLPQQVTIRSAIANGQYSSFAEIESAIAELASKK